MKYLFVLSFMALTSCVGGNSADWITTNMAENVANTMRCARSKMGVCVCVWVAAEDRRLSGIAIDSSGASCR